jgi:hypothetical protein
VVTPIAVIASFKADRKIDGPRRIVCITLELGASSSIHAGSRVFRQAPVLLCSRQGTASEIERLRPLVVLFTRSMMCKTRPGLSYSMEVADVDLPCGYELGGSRASWVLPDKSSRRPSYQAARDSEERRAPSSRGSEAAQGRIKIRGSECCWRSIFRGRCRRIVAAICGKNRCSAKKEKH